MKLLAIDTATEACSAALWLDGQLLERYEVMGRGHAERILPMIDELLVTAGLKLNALDALAVGRGPGAFTGVRIAIGVAQGLGLGSGLPVFPVSDLAALGLQALDAYARDCPTALEPVEALVALDARMGEVYCARVRRHPIEGVELLEERLADPAVAFLSGTGRGTRIGAGHGYSAYPALKDRLAGELAACWPALLPRAAEIAVLGAALYAAGARPTADAAAPVYLRDQVAHQSARPKA